MVLAAGVYAINESALIKPANRSFTRAARLTIRAEVAPDEPTWSPQSMPVLIHTMPLSPNWMGRPDPFGGVSYRIRWPFNVSGHASGECALWFQKHQTG